MKNRLTATNKVGIFLVVILSYSSCIEKVDLILAEQPIFYAEELHLIRLSHSTRFNKNPIFIANNPNVFDAVITIVDDFGNEETLYRKDIFDTHTPNFNTL